jgi:Na+/H+-dicarboxylate symporter
MLNRFKKISLGNWIFIGMFLGVIVGLFLNLFVDNHFIKDVILMDNVFYLGGNIFIRLMKMLVVPLVFCSLVVGVSSLSDINKIFTVGGRTIILYLITSLIGIFIAFTVSAVFKPGVGVNLSAITQTSNVTLNQTMTELVLDIIPENPLNALASSEMLPVIIVGAIMGFILFKLSNKTPTLNNLFKELNKIMITMTGIVLKFAPFGIFCLMARTFGTLGLENIFSLTKYMNCVVFVLLIQLFVVYPIILLILTKVNPLRFYRKFMSVMFFAFSTLSSNATIPLNMHKLEDMGVSHVVSSFTVPLGATINKNGTIIMQSVATMFAAQYFGMDLGTSAILTAVFTLILASSSTPSVPFSGLATLTLVFTSIGIPLEMIGLLVGIDHILDTFRTAVNITGDAICTIVVDFKNKTFDVDVFNNKKRT